jgi:hypothetical protein
MTKLDSTEYSNLILHIGVQKTGTTFVQNAVFPLWKGIQYIHTDKLELILRCSREKPVLLSREGLSGQNWAHHDVRELSIARLAQLFPNARIMLSFRRHSKYIASSYCQYLQRGGYLPFEQYFDPQNDTGYMKIDDFRFALKVGAVQRYFGRSPFVFFQEELHRDIEALLGDMEDFIGGTAPAKSQIKNKKYNQSVKYHPAILLRFLNRYSRSELNPQGRLPLYHQRLVRLKMDPRSICQNWLQFAPNRPIITPEVSEVIDSLYQEDWNLVQAAAESRSGLADLQFGLHPTA